MPHITIEHSSNTFETVDPKPFLKKVHALMASFETINLNDLKSRCVKHEHSCIGNGDSENAFVHLRLELLAGRDPTLKANMAKQLLSLIKKELESSSARHNTDVSIEIRDMSRDLYFKGEIPNFAKVKS